MVRMNDAMVCDKPFVAPKAAGVGAAERMKTMMMPMKNLSNAWAIQLRAGILTE
jgi:hypothetical protein